LLLNESNLRFRPVDVGSDFAVLRLGLAIEPGELRLVLCTRGRELRLELCLKAEQGVEFGSHVLSDKGMKKGSPVVMWRRQRAVARMMLHQQAIGLRDWSMLGRDVRMHLVQRPTADLQ
jgi:hypothetical protein